MAFAAIPFHVLGLWGGLVWNGVRGKGPLLKLGITPAWQASGDTSFFNV